MLLDYATLKIIWWCFITVLFAVFFVLGGRDFGVNILLPFVGKTDDDRRLIINSMGATWEGNQVWFITAGGAVFAAWPMVYATGFSGLYYALFLVLISLILRPPGMDFRSKMKSQAWRSMWDWALFISGFVPALVFGVGLGNLMLGIPFDFDDILQSHYHGSFWALLNPFAVLFGLCSVAILMLQGGVYLQKKLIVDFTETLKRINIIAALGFVTLFVLIGIWIAWGVNGFQIETIGNLQDNLIPVHKQVAVMPKAWLKHYHEFPLLWSLPILAVICALGAAISSAKEWCGCAVFLSSLTIILALLTANVAMYPFILPSSVNPDHSLTLWDSVSSHRSLQYMFWVAVFFLPIITFYTSWVYKVISGKMEVKTTLNKPEAY